MGVGISLSGLASAVANEGGIGVIATAGIGMDEPDFHSDFPTANIRALRREIRTARSRTSGLIGANLMVANSNYAELMQTCLEEEIDFVFSGAGLPLDMPRFLQSSSKTKLVPIVSSARAAQLLCRRWLKRYDYLPDAVVVEGPRAGGHLGFTKAQLDDPVYSLENLMPEVVKTIAKVSTQYGKKIPVIAAGGIFTGADIKSIFDLGADGVQMGTRFVATHECDADIAFKHAYVHAEEKDVVIIDSPVGMPGRAICNGYLDDVSCGIKKPYKCSYHCILSCDYTSVPYCIAHALTSAKRGKFRSGFAFAGANVPLVREIVSVRELCASLLLEYEKSQLEHVA